MKNDEGYIKVMEGIKRKTLCHGEKTLMAQFVLDSGVILPMHNHPQEQTGYLVSGHLQLTIGEERHDIHPGETWIVPGHVPHGAQALAACVAIEVFSPPRQDYLP